VLYSITSGWECTQEYIILLACWLLEHIHSLIRDMVIYFAIFECRKLAKHASSNALTVLGITCMVLWNDIQLIKLVSLKIFQDTKGIEKYLSIFFRLLKNMKKKTLDWSFLFSLSLSPGWACIRGFTYYDRKLRQNSSFFSIFMLYKSLPY